MSRLLILAALIGSLAITSYTVSAKNIDNPGKANGQATVNSAQSQNQGRDQDKQNQKENEIQEASESGGNNPRPTSCDPNANWKNHGEYVSCVARLKQGGATTSAAARSDIGKKNKDGSASGSITPTPASGSGVISTPSATPTSTGSGLLSTNAVQTEVNNIIKNIQGLLKRLQHLFSF